MYIYITDDTIRWSTLIYFYYFIIMINRIQVTTSARIHVYIYLGTFLILETFSDRAVDKLVGWWKRWDEILRCWFATIDDVMQDPTWPADQTRGLASFPLTVLPKFSYLNERPAILFQGPDLLTTQQQRFRHPDQLAFVFLFWGE